MSLHTIKPPSLLGDSKSSIDADISKIAHTAAPENELSSVPIPQAKKSFRFKMTVFMTCTISVVVAMDSVIVAAALPAITVSLDGTSLKAFWVGTSYLLAQTVCHSYEGAPDH